MKSSIFCLFLSGCALFVDLSEGARHQIWVEDMLRNVGQKNMYDCLYWICKDRSDLRLFEGDKLLSNGNLEARYRWPATQKCRYFFEYERATGLIVGFRFEESEQFACRFSGA